ncbi:MAG: cytochrome c biogenesis protein CcsA [Actinomycetota bacterium]|nr:MAG: cytochrome c assembly [Actinomycetota bacterium]MDO8950245.1 cytochrome c biogenesis protein CcsA [Actinomycetota bacterium]MDP3630876.1 cytochrome c biogenesis protein CcsA [Actinomycetota bacterium]
MTATVEILLMWATVTAYALSAALFVVSIIFKQDTISRIALGMTCAGVIPHVAAIVGRWVRIGHGPYIGFYEVVSSYALIGVVIFIALALARKPFRAFGVALMPMAFLALGGAMLASKTEVAITPNLASYWLVVHVAFAKLSYGSFITATGLAIVHILRLSRREVKGDGFFASLTPESLDDLTAKFVSAGFVFLGIMIAAGAIWANEAWGRYWAWDPIETWSLVSWLVYAVVLHLRRTMGWVGKRFAWITIAALPVLLFALIGVVIVYESIHGAYLLIGG